MRPLLHEAFLILLRWRWRVKDIVGHRPIGSLELLLGFASLFRGLIWFFTTTPMWTKSFRPVWIILANLLPDRAWGVFFILVGLLQIYAVLEEHLTIRKWCAGGSFVSWTFASALFFLGENILPNDGMLPLMSLASLLVFWTLPLEPREG